MTRRQIWAYIERGAGDQERAAELMEASTKLAGARPAALASAARLGKICVRFGKFSIQEVIKLEVEIKFREHGLQIYLFCQVLHGRRRAGRQARRPEAVRAGAAARPGPCAQPAGDSRPALQSPVQLHERVCSKDPNRDSGASACALHPVSTYRLLATMLWCQVAFHADSHEDVAGPRAWQ